MEEIKYIGETLWLGAVGNIAIVLGFVAACFSAVAYFAATKNRNKPSHTSWLKLGQIGYIVHGVSILGLMSLIFYGMMTHKYEYKYIFEHVSDDLPMRYILSAFWEGQEGSFMLWMFWHILLGYLIIYKEKTFQAPVMMVLAFVEVWINSMLLGIFAGWGENLYKIGSNPVALIREVTAAPVFSNANYLELIKGRGLNPLLQNYWMTIHPPTTFLGFASTTIPFAYAVGGLMYKEDNLWLKSVQRWSLFSGAILGIGILMGSLWAYEALSFGGYWAWDPVENTSLVPWIVMIAGIHTCLIAINTGYSIRFTYFSFLASFVLIVYSTLLTRSGILGDTSAHAFTEMGLEWQLTGFLLFFIGMGIWLFIKRWKTIPNKKKEEASDSREFWMFIGSMVLLLSAFLIDFSSSLPVFNTIVNYFDKGYVGKVIKDPITHYNKYQLWIAVFISVLSAVAVYMRYRGQQAPGWLRKFGIRTLAHIVAAGLLTYLLSTWIALPSWQYLVLALTCIYTVVVNTDYIFNAIKKSWGLTSSAVAHLGFGLMIVGVLASGLNSFYLNNSFIFKGIFAEGDDEKYIQLIKNKPLLIRGHIATYKSDTLIGRMRHYDIQFNKIDKDLNVLDSFVTRPNAVYANDFSKVAAFNPDTRHYLSKDIFTCIIDLPPSVRDMEEAKKMEDSLKFKTYDLAIGDTITIDGGYLQVDDISLSPTHPEYAHSSHDFGVEVAYTIKSRDGSLFHSSVAASGLSGNLLYKYPSKSEDFATIVRPADAIFDKVLTSDEKLNYKDIIVKQGQSFEFEGTKSVILGFDNTIDSSRYQLKSGDIAIAAIIAVSDGQKVDTLHPVYIIRGSAPMGMKDYGITTGTHIRLANIDPTTETFTLKVARDQKAIKTVPIEIATEVPRTDYIILEAKVFPGINLFWLGSLLMMVGLTMAWFYRKTKQALSQEVL